MHIHTLYCTVTVSSFISIGSSVQEEFSIGSSVQE